jgi:hypothetical protein
MDHDEVQDFAFELRDRLNKMENDILLILERLDDLEEANESDTSRTSNS